MRPSRLNNSFLAKLFGRLWQRPASDFGPRRGRQTHVVILDGTMSSLDEGHETNAGLAYKLVRKLGTDVSVYYEPGLQWNDWASTHDVAAGRGINRQIRRAYGYLSSRYHPGDRIYLFGYSRGAYAVRSLAGVIDRIGLLRNDHATERNIRQAYRHYECHPGGSVATDFSRAFCYPHGDVGIEMIGVWDTVKSLGFNLPLIWRFSAARHSFHSHGLADGVKNGFHALALHETREVFRPVLWASKEGFAGRLEQVWFPGTHGDVGGQLGGFLDARPLANIPFVWMMSRAQECGLTLPDGWEDRYPKEPSAPSTGTWRGVGKFFLIRRKRSVGSDPSERVHESAAARREALPRRDGVFAKVRRAG